MDKKRVRILLLGIVFVLTCLAIVLSSALSHSITTLQQAGVSPDIVYFTLILPYIGLFLALSRIVIGINIPNTFVPLTIVLTSFVIGPVLTLLLMIFSLVLGYLGKYLISELHLHFAVKISIIIGLLSVGLTLLLPFLVQSQLLSSSNGHLIIIYGIMIISLINEKYLVFKLTRASIFEDLKNILNTFLFSLVSFWLLGGKIELLDQIYEFPYLKSFILFFPESVLFIVFIIIFIGRYTGLRLTEVFRFRKLLFKNR
jgi:hypothetical protein